MKYRFEIIYQTKWIKEAGEFFKKCDLGFNDMGLKEIITCNSKNDLNVIEMKELIKNAYEYAECRLLHIEGGKVE